MSDELKWKSAGELAALIPGKSDAEAFGMLLMASLGGLAEQFMCCLMMDERNAVVRGALDSLVAKDDQIKKLQAELAASRALVDELPVMLTLGLVQVITVVLVVKAAATFCGSCVSCRTVTLELEVHPFIGFFAITSYEPAVTAVGFCKFEV